MFKLQRNIPVPAPVRDLSNIKRRYPYHDMDVGEFFFVPNKTKNTLSSHASTVGHRLGRKFITRLTHARLDTKGAWKLCDASAENAVQGIGVWREA